MRGVIVFVGVCGVMGWWRVRMRIVKLSGIIWDASIYGNDRRGDGFVQSNFSPPFLLQGYELMV